MYYVLRNSKNLDLYNFVKKYFDNPMLIDNLDAIELNKNNMITIFADFKIKQPIDFNNYLVISDKEQEYKNFFKVDFTDKKIDTILKLIVFMHHSNEMVKAKCFKDISCTYNHIIRNKLTTLQFYLNQPDPEKIKNRQSDINDIIEVLKKIDQLQYNTNYTMEDYSGNYNLIE